MTTLAGLSLDLFLLGHAQLAAGQAGCGAAFERRVRNHLGTLGLPDARACAFLTGPSNAGLNHQIDEQTICRDARVIGEWKAHRGRIPKNDLIRFKAVTDDYWMSRGHNACGRTLRLFGGTGSVTESMRVFAAQWGIVMIVPDVWPIPALCDPDLLWSTEVPGPGPADCRVLASLIRPMEHVLAHQPDGSWWMPPFARTADIAARLRVWEYWSQRAWYWWDECGRGRFESLLDERLFTHGAHAA